jgi:hypothetical protein
VAELTRVFFGRGEREAPSALTYYTRRALTCDQAIREYRGGAHTAFFFGRRGEREAPTGLI